MEIPDVIPDFDRDAIHVLPLGIIPLEATGLKKLRMIKNDALESVVEVYGGTNGGGSGQVKLEALPLTFSNVSRRDLKILQKLAGLTSYDVYCLRVHLRALGIAVDEDKHLKLSEGQAG